MKKYPTGKRFSEMTASELIDAYKAETISEPDFILWMQRRGESFNRIMNVITG